MPKTQSPTEFPAPGDGGGLIPQTRDQLIPLGDTTMRPNPLRPVIDPDLDVEENPDSDRLYAIDHSGPDEEPDWHLYRRIGETRDWSSLREQYMTHHVLIDAEGKKWRIDWRAWQTFKDEDTARQAHAESSFAQRIIGLVRNGAYDWPAALQMIETIEPGQEPADGLQEHTAKNRMIGEVSA